MLMILHLFPVIMLSFAVLFFTTSIYAQPFNSNTFSTIQPFNLAVAADWGCKDDAKQTSQNIQDKSPELVIAPGDLSYEESSHCWVDIISPFKHKLMISMGDHEYHDTKDGIAGVIKDYLYPLELPKTYYSFDYKNIHIVSIDPYIDYSQGSTQYRFIENDLRNSASDPMIDWIFVMEHIPMYTSSSEHPADSTLREVFHPIFEKYSVDIVFSGDNHNYQRSFPLKYNGDGDSSNPIQSSTNLNNYEEDNGVIYIIAGTAGRSHYEITDQAPFIANQDDTNFGFLNIDINDKIIEGTFYANNNKPGYNYVDYENNIIDTFTISKNKSFEY